MGYDSRCGRHAAEGKRGAAYVTAFDHVVVGAGSAGCVLAGRLTEDAARRDVLLEAGGRDRSPNIKIPAAFAKQFHTKLWKPRQCE
jgi:choline dehydrogenase-like flavoprotein